MQSRLSRQSNVSRSAHPMLRGARRALTVIAAAATLAAGGAGAAERVEDDGGACGWQSERAARLRAAQAVRVSVWACSVTATGAVRAG